ncbi:MAG: hypothetical protein Q8L74_15920 [Nitrospirota bacterium]|nr:hypothetical protein [Nitrospirota bacterium]MDP2383110.1 hypothetical protein [Nitrospirota bacterium]MDP3599310.1 hypothetical protein [Nitrospirota bacterium]
MRVRIRWFGRVVQQASISAGRSKSPSSKAAADERTGGVALGYVEDAFEARTKLAGIFQRPSI